MTWLTPMLALWAGAVAVPTLLLLYFLKLKRREVEVSTTLLWRKAVQDLQANAPFQRLRNNILLLLQLLALLLVIAALGQPELRAGAPETNRHVLLIDRSASMRAADAPDGVTRLEHAKQEALDFIDAMREPGVGGGGLLADLLGAGPADEAMVIAFDAAADVLQPFTSDKNALRRAVQRIEPSDAPTRIDEALRLAGAYAQPVFIEERGLVPTGPVAALRLYSDGRIEDAERATVPPHTPMTYHRAGAASSANAAIVAARAQREYENPDLVNIFIAVQREGPAGDDPEVELRIDGRVVAIRPVRLSGEEGDPVATGGVVFTFNRPEGGLIEARLLGEDALRVDDEAALVLPGSKRLAAGLVTDGSLYLQSALEGLPLARLVVITPEQMRRQAQRGELDALDVLILDGLPPPRAGDATRPGRYLVLGHAPPMPGISAEGEMDSEPQVVLDWRRDHPALELAGLARLVVGQTPPMRVEPPAVAIAQGERGPLIAEAFDGAARAMIVAFDPAASTWPLDPGFVLFLATAVQTLGADDAGAADEPLRPGQTLSTRIPPGARQVRLRAPSGRTFPLTPGEGGEVVYGPLRETGLHTLSWRGEAGAGDAEEAGRVERLFAVNLADPLESRIEPVETLALASREVQQAGAARSADQRRRLWPWLLLAALGVVMFEWFIYNRRVAL